MDIQGLQKMTLLDYPGRVACTMFLGGCDLRCPFCHNATLVELEREQSAPPLALEKFRDFLQRRQGLLDGVCVSGGEPLLNPQLPQLLELVKGLGYLVKVEPHQHNVGTCYRCHSDVEPLISAQWFVKMEPLAKEALRVVNDGEVKFVPDRFSKTYTNWMENVHDWCISRQLWWGHQIPAWTCQDCGHITVSETDPTECEHCHSKHITQEEDVLDTWFSSALWPFTSFNRRLD